MDLHFSTLEIIIKDIIYKLYFCTWTQMNIHTTLKLRQQVGIDTVIACLSVLLLNLRGYIRHS